MSTYRVIYRNTHGVDVVVEVDADNELEGGLMADVALRTHGGLTVDEIVAHECISVVQVEACQ